MSLPLMNFKLSDEDKERWKKAALKEGRTLSGLIKYAVEKYIREKE